MLHDEAKSGREVCDACAGHVQEHRDSGRCTVGVTPPSARWEGVHLPGLDRVRGGRQGQKTHRGRDSGEEVMTNKQDGRVKGKVC